MTGDVVCATLRWSLHAGFNQREVETFGPVEFLARVIMHIPEPRRHLIRFYGWYSNVSRMTGARWDE